jgi:hypothetical protein
VLLQRSVVLIALAAHGQFVSRESVVPGLISPSNLLEQSRLIEDQLLPDERCFLLFRIASVAAHIDRKMALVEANKILEITSQLDASPNREVLRKNAVVALSQVDPDRAFNLLEQLGPLNSIEIPEDLRASAAETVFPNYLKLHGTSGFAEIEIVARQIGDTGLYPFRAMAFLVPQLRTPESSALCNRIYDEALRYYRERSPAGYSSNFFADFLQKTWTGMPERTRKGSIHALLDRLLTSIPTPSDQAVYRVWTGLDATFVEFTNVHDALLYELIPKIVETGYSSTLMERRPTWGKFLKGSISSDGFSDPVLVGRSSVPSEAFALAENRALASHQISVIHRLLRTDKERAIHEVSSLSSPSIRAQILFEIADELLKERHRSRCYELLQRGEGDLKHGADDESKLTALARFAQTAFDANDAQLLRRGLEEGYDLGEELFEQFIETHPAAPHYDSPIVVALGKLGDIGLRFESQRTLSRIESAQDPILRAYLLVEAADSLRLRGVSL